MLNASFESMKNIHVFTNASHASSGRETFLNRETQSISTIWWFWIGRNNLSKKILFFWEINRFESWLKNLAWPSVSSSVHGFREYFINEDSDNILNAASMNTQAISSVQRGRSFRACSPPLTTAHHHSLCSTLDASENRSCFDFYVFSWPLNKGIFLHKHTKECNSDYTPCPALAERSRKISSSENTWKYSYFKDT
jgi:hypothetical protein